MQFGLLLVIAFIISLDQLTKYWVNTHLPVMSKGYFSYPYGGIGIFENFLGIEFSISHLDNRGAAWGMLHEFQVPLVFLRIGLIACMVCYLCFFNKHPLWRLPLCLVIAGAIGNVIDYFFYGHVVDMLHFVIGSYSFPVFNIADSAVTLGIVSLFILSAWEERISKKAT